MADFISESETSATTTGTASNIRRFIYGVSGTFVGTWELQVLIGGVWHAIDTGTSTKGAVGVDGMIHADYRFEVTAYTSGTLTFNLASSSTAAT